MRRALIIALTLLLMLGGGFTPNGVPGVMSASAETGAPYDTGGGDPAGDGVSATDGDWLVEAADDLMYQDMTLVLNGNLTVDGKLTLVNVTLMVNTTGQGSHGIRVADGGSLIIRDGDGDPQTTSDNSELRAAVLDGAHRFAFTVDQNGTLIMMNSTLRGCGYPGDYDSPSLGLHIRGDTSFLYGLSISNCEAGVIFNGTGEGYIEDSTINSSLACVVAVNGAQATIASCDIQPMGFGVYSRDSGSRVMVDNCTLAAAMTGGEKDLKTESGGFIHIINSSFSKADGTGGAIRVSNYLHIHFIESYTGEDLQGVDVNVKSDMTSIYKSTGWGGTDKKSDAAGMVYWILADHGWYDDTSTLSQNATDIEAWINPTSGCWWNYTYDVDMSTSHTAELKIDKTPPTAPTELIVTFVNDTVVNLSWTESQTTDDEPSRYDVHYNSYDSSEPDTTDNLNKVVSHSVTGLSPRTEYWFAVSSADIRGNKSPWSNTVNAITTDETAPPKPQNVYADSATRNSLSLHWSPSSADDLGGYSIYISPANSSDTSMHYANTSAGKLSMDITGLERESTYTFRMTAFDDYVFPNVSPLSDPAAGATLDVTPPLPPVLMARESPTVDSEVNVQGFVYREYDEASGAGVPEPNATAFVYVNNNSAGEAKVVTQTGMFSVPVTLKPGMNYIHARADDGEDEPNLSPPSEGLIIILDTEAPVADAGPDIFVDVGTLVVLEGRYCTDNVRITDYTWTFDDGDGDQVLHNDPGTINTTWTFQSPGAFEVSLYVSDKAGNTAGDTFSVLVRVQDTTPPGVASKDPEDGDTGVNISAAVTVRFDEPVLPASLSFAVEWNGTVKGERSFTEDGRTLTWSPDTVLGHNTTYTVTLSVADLEGNLLDGYTWSFTTGPPPAGPGEDLDTDGDGIPDEWERIYYLDPLDPGDAGLDPDRDALTNLQEYENGTDPFKEDTDNDGYSDLEELQAGTDPNDAVSMPGGEENGDGGGEKEGLSAGLIAGIAAAAALAVVMALLLVLLAKKKKPASEGVPEEVTKGGAITPMKAAVEEEEEVDNCPKCGAALGGGDDFCPECGEVLGKGKGKVPLVVKKDELLVGMTGEVKALPPAGIEPGRIHGRHEPAE